MFHINASRLWSFANCVCSRRLQQMNIPRLDQHDHSPLAKLQNCTASKLTSQQHSRAFFSWLEPLRLTSGHLQVKEACFPIKQRPAKTEHRRTSVNGLVFWSVVELSILRTWRWETRASDRRTALLGGTKFTAKTEQIKGESYLGLKVAPTAVRSLRSFEPRSVRSGCR